MRNARRVRSLSNLVRFGKPLLCLLVVAAACGTRGATRDAVPSATPSATAFSPSGATAVGGKERAHPAWRVPSRRSLAAAAFLTASSIRLGDAA
jgi:hypothetical protein